MIGYSEDDNSLTRAFPESTYWSQLRGVGYGHDHDVITVKFVFNLLCHYCP